MILFSLVMNMFKLKIDTKNQAFSQDRISEIVRILEEAILKLRQGNDKQAILLDINGNVVGGYTLTKN